MAIACLAAAFIINGAARAECPTFPTSASWGNLSHDKAVRYVAKMHDGDWSPYVKKWKRQLASLEKIQANGGTVVFKKKGLRLKGEALDDYVLKVKERVMVNNCLAEEDEVRTTEARELDNFPTAAGSNDPALQMAEKSSFGRQAGSRSQIERGITIADQWVR